MSSVQPQPQPQPQPQSQFRSSIAFRKPRRSLWILRCKLLGGLIFALLAACALGYWELSTTQKVASLHAISAPISRLERVLIDCETGLRGYWQDRFREPVGYCRRAASDHIQAIRELSGPEARSITANALSTIESVLEDHDNAKQLMDQSSQSSISVEEMDRRLALVHQARAGIARLLTDRDVSYRKAIENQSWLHNFAMVVLLSTMIGMGWLYWRIRLAAHQLIEHSELERAIWEQSGDALFLFDLETEHIIDVNAVACSLLNMPRDEIVGKPWVGFVPSHFLAEARANVSKVGLQPLKSLPGVLLDGDGQEVPVETSISSEISLDGRRLAVSAFRSLIAREAALQKAAFLSAVENTIPSGLAAVSDDGEQIFANAKLADMLGWSSEELVGKRPPFVYWPPEEVDRIESVLQSAVAGKIPQSGAEITLMRRSGERFPVLLFISRIGYERRPGWLALVIDISNRKRVEAALEQSRRLESIGLLAGQVAHDFNNLLMIISMNVAVLERALQNDAKSTELLNGVGEATKRGIAITKTLLTVASRQELAPQRVDLRLQLQQCKQLFVASCGPSIKIILELPLESVWVDVDTGGLSGALLNLVNNARDAMSDGGTITLRLSTRFIETPTGSRRTGNYGVIEVVDTGQGMEPEVMARAFEPFFSTRGSRGTGLGLATVYGFSHQSGGDVLIDSKPGRGTSISLFIPLQSPESCQASRPLNLGLG